ncbi:hypothetical protein RFI_07417 [Reticulomyxa filosa]|uniref:GPR180/TMEM145 transmembrane domain-containing protein n=1 Tax=Reticulomyxa filosa TaxID=46433 RepID=X6NUY0_RETFI|nr:hypothetical protein RFI_07417 [Reticulomyxa filosa]|eukprot:ETO29703.1 hypothetical protein RFI_07417 [Reticulomyxa filosa]
MYKSFVFKQYSSNKYDQVVIKLTFIAPKKDSNDKYICMCDHYNPLSKKDAINFMLDFFVILLLFFNGLYKNFVCLTLAQTKVVSTCKKIFIFFKYGKSGELHMQIQTEKQETNVTNLLDCEYQNKNVNPTISADRRILSENDNTKAVHTLRLYHWYVKYLQMCCINVFFICKKKFCCRNSTDKELDEIKAYRTVSAFCGQIESFSCVWNGYINDDSELSIDYDFTSTKTQTLTMLAVNCDESGYKYRVLLNKFFFFGKKAQYHLTAKNGKNEYLSLSEIPYKQLYIFLGLLWALVSVVWIVHWYRYKHFNIKYHRLVSLYPLLKVVSCVLWHFFWVYCSKKGVESFDLSFSVRLTDSLADGWLFLSLILLAEGWNWLRNGLEGRRQYVEIGVWFLLFVASTVASYYCLSIAIVVAFALVLGLYRVLSCWMFNMRDLKGQKELLEIECPQMMEDKDAPINIKISVFQSLQTAVGGFLLAHIVLQFFDPLFVESPWINTLLIHCIFIGFICFLGYASNHFVLFYSHYFYFLSQFTTQRENIQTYVNRYRVRMRPFRPGFYVMEYSNDGTPVTQFPEVRIDSSYFVFLINISLYHFQTISISAKKMQIMANGCKCLKEK